MRKRTVACVAVALAAALLLPDAAEARRKRKRRKAPAKQAQKEKQKRREPMVVPVDVAIGPALLHGFGKVGADQRFHYGLKVSVQAIIDQALIKRNLDKIPAKYRGLARGVKEARISPSIFIPDTLIISPKLENTGMYGITWRPVAITVPLVRRPVRFDVSPGLILTYAFLHSDTLTGPDGGVVSSMHFARPGLDVKVELEIPLSQSFLVSVGWSSQLHVPQVIGGAFTEVTPVEDALWHIGQAFLKLHFRIPYRV